MNDDDLLSDYLIDDTPRCALPDLKYTALAAGLVVVVLGMAIVGASWLVKRLRTW